MDLVGIRLTVVKGIVTCTSLQIANMFGKQHAHVLRDIEEYIMKDSLLPYDIRLDVSTGGSINFFKTFYKDSRGRRQVMYSLTEEGFAAVVMDYKGDFAFAYKAAYRAEFNRMRMAIESQEQWGIKRIESIVSRKALTEVIQKYIAYAIAQDPNCSYAKTPGFAYANFTTMGYKTLWGLSKVEPKFRDTLAGLDLSILMLAEENVRKILIEGMDANLPYKEIYQNCVTACKELSKFALPRQNLTGNPFVVTLLEGGCNQTPASKTSLRLLPTPE